MAEEKNGNRAYWIKVFLEVLIAVLLGGGAGLIITGQYRNKVDTHAERIADLQKEQAVQLEKLQKVEVDGAVQKNETSNLSIQMSESFKEVKDMIKEMKRELKEEIKTKRDK